MPKHARLRYMTTPVDDGTPGAIPPATPPAPRTFSQDELTAIATREKEQGRIATLREVSEMLGGMRVEDAAELIKAARAADEANKTQAQRDAETAAAEKAAAQADRAAAAKERHDAHLERLLGAAGAADVEIAAGALGVQVGADDATIKTAIDALKTRVPGLFGVTPAANTDPGAPPPPPPAKGNAFAAGAAEAERRYAKR